VCFSSLPPPECLKEVWKGADTSNKGEAEEAASTKEEGKTHDGGEL